MRFFNAADPNRPDALLRPGAGWIWAKRSGSRNTSCCMPPRQTGKTSVLFALQGLLNGAGPHCLFAVVEGADASEKARRKRCGRFSGSGRPSLLFVETRRGTSLTIRSWSRSGPTFLRSPAPTRGVDGCAGALVPGVAETACAADRRDRRLAGRIDDLGASAVAYGLFECPAAFPQSRRAARDVRDYRMESTSTPSNIGAKSLRSGDFSREETLALLAQQRRRVSTATPAGSRDRERFGRAAPKKRGVGRRRS